MLTEVLDVGGHKLVNVSVCIQHWVSGSFLLLASDGLERAGPSTSSLLPSSLRGKDGRTKDEFQKLNGTSELSSEWVSILFRGWCKVYGCGAA